MEIYQVFKLKNENNFFMVLSTKENEIHLINVFNEDENMSNFISDNRNKFLNEDLLLLKFLEIDFSKNKSYESFKNYLISKFDVFN